MGQGRVMNFWLEFSFPCLLFFPFFFYLSHFFYIHLGIFILCKNFLDFPTLFLWFPFFSFCVVGLQNSQDTIQAFFFLLLMNHFWGERGKRGYDGLGLLSFSSSCSSHLFCFSMFRMHRLCSRETAGFCHSLAFLCYLRAFMHIKGVWFSHAFSFLSFASQIQPSRKK